VDRASEIATWIERHGSELRRHLERMLPGRDDAEDALQRVWITAHRSPPEARDGPALRAWLYRVATNAALDRLGADRRHRCALEGRALFVAPDPHPAPDSGLQGLEERGRRRVREHVAALPTKQRQAVWMRWFEGRGYDEIAARLGCSEESARGNVYQGMKRLRRELFDLWQEEVEA
jgi:RNA polymerase sigma-70 factor (ECF subfamily)